jgi:hypothetical protein
MVSILHPFLGGLLIGAGAAALLLLNGQVAGISGIAANVLHGQAGPFGWRAAFLLGLVAPAVLVGLGPTEFAGGYGWMAVSGLLVGIGTRIGSGCTSGHGVCGIANLSPRSFAATAMFMATAMLTVFVVRHVAAP